MSTYIRDGHKGIDRRTSTLIKYTVQYFNLVRDCNHPSATTDQMKCGETIRANNSYLVNDDYPSKLMDIDNCQYTIQKVRLT